MRETTTPTNPTSPTSEAPGSQNAAVLHALEALGRTFGDRLVTPEDDKYDDRRAVWNGTVDKRPAAIAVCRTVEDVQAAVRAATRYGVPLSVRGGGHNVAGYASVNRGLVIDLSEMRSVQVDPVRRRARVAGGATWADVDRLTQSHGLAAPGGVVSDTGVGGLTLGGGIGWLRRKYGLTCDNLVAAEVVTADGRAVRADAVTNPDLLWALRGGGGNFGVVTSFEFALHPVGPEVMFAFVLYSRSDAPEVLRAYRSYCLTAPDEVSSFAILGTVPDEEAFPEAIHGEPYVLIAALHAGTVDEGRHELASLRNLASPLLDASSPMPYREVQTILDADYPSGRRYYWTSAYLNDVTDDTIATLLDFADRRPSALSTVDVWHLGGAIRRQDPDATAFAQRAPEFLLGAEANWADPSADEANAQWARACRDSLAEREAPTYLNFPGGFEGGSAELRASFGSSFERLREVKRRWDPGNVFWSTQNVAP